MSAYTGDIVKDGLTLYLDAANYKSFVSGSTTWYDLARPGFTGSLINGPAYTGSNKGAIIFDGTNDYVSLPSSSLASSSQMTFALWNFGQSITNPRSVIYFENASGIRTLNVHLTYHGTIYFDAGNGSGNTGGAFDRINKGVTASELFGWQYWVFTKNATAGTMRIYRNGELWHSGGGSAPIGASVTGSLGASLSIGWYHVGHIGMAKLYSRELSAAEIRENYNATKGRYDTTRSSDAIKPRLSTSGLVLHLDAANYRSYTGSGIIWRDLSGKGNDAALNNGPVFNSGNGGHFVFDGSNDYVGITNPSTLNMGGKSFTADIWIAVSTTSGTERMILEYNVWPNQGTYQVTTQPNQIVVNFIDANGAGKALYHSIPTFTNGAWTNVVGQFDTINNTISLYINGSRVAQNTAVTQEIGNAVSNLYICSRGGGSLFLPCKMASVKMYDRALSADEIFQNYNLTKGRYGYVL